MRQFKNGVKVLLVLASVIISASATQADERPLSPSEAIKSIGGLKLITLHLKDATPLEFYTEVWRQLDLPAFDASSVERSRSQSAITIDVEKRPFWEVMRQVEQKYGISARPDSSSQRVLPNLSPMNLVGAVDIKNPFYFVINGVTVNKNCSLVFSVDKPLPSVQNSLSLSFRAIGDPQMAWLNPNPTPVVTKAINNKGESMLISTSNPGRYSGSYFGNSFSFGSINLIPQAKPGGKVAHLEGYVDAMFAVNSETLEVDDLANAGNVERGVVPKQIDSSAPVDNISYVAVDNVIRIDNGYSFEVKFLRPSSSLKSWQFNEFMTSNLRVVDDQGKDLQRQNNSSMSWFNDSDPVSKKLQGATYRYTFKRTDNNSSDGPVKLIWKYPLDIRTVEVPFEFNNVPLP